MAAGDFDTITLRDQRYNAIFHLVTAADGAVQYYTLANNETRTEGPAQAIALDRYRLHGYALLQRLDAHLFSLRRRHGSPPPSC